MHMPKLARWGRAAVVAAVAFAAVLVFVSLPSGQELDRDSGKVTEVRSFHTTSKGTVIMSNGDVHQWSGQGDIVYTGDSQGYIEYEGCSFPFGKDIYLCRTEWVEVDGIRYEKEDTSEGPGEWKVVDRVAPSDPNTGMPFDPAKALENFIQRYDLLELKGGFVGGVAYKRFRGDFSPSRRMLERIKAGEWEPPNESKISLEDFIGILEEQAGAETGSIELWAREDDSTMWRVITERDNLDVIDSRADRSTITKRTYDVLEYSRYNEPVVIKPPI